MVTKSPCCLCGTEPYNRTLIRTISTLGSDLYIELPERENHSRLSPDPAPDPHPGSDASLGETVEASRPSVISARVAGIMRAVLSAARLPSADIAR